MTHPSTTFAKRLASYISHADTIRILTQREYGQAPCIDTIKGMQDRHKRAKDAFEREHYHKDFADDGSDYQPASLVKRPSKRMYEAGPDYQPVFLNLPTFTSDTDEPIHTPLELAAAVAKAFGFTLREVLGPCRETRYVCARAVIAKLMTERKPALYTPTFIGQVLKKDRSSIRNVLEKFDDRAKRFPEMRIIYERFSAKAGAEA